MAIAVAPFVALTVARAQEAVLAPDLLRLVNGSYAGASFLGAHAYYDGYDANSAEYSPEVMVRAWRGLGIGSVVPVVSTGEGHELGNVGIDVRAIRAGTGRRLGFGGSLRVWLPTYSDDEIYGPGSPFGQRGNMLNAAHHSYDPGRFAASATTFRPTAAVGATWGPAQAQLESGIDVVVPTGAEPTKTAFHLGFAPGLVAGPLSAFIQVTLFKYADGPETSALAAGVRLRVGEASVGLAVRRPTPASVGQQPYLSGTPTVLDVLAFF
jgi:hypothetical protein